VAAFVIAQHVSAAEESELWHLSLLGAFPRPKNQKWLHPALQVFRKQSRDAVPVLALSTAARSCLVLSAARKLSHMRAIIQHRARHEVAAPYNKRLQATRSKQRAPETRRWA
jgi:hypothetical protein